MSVFFGSSLGRDHDYFSPLGLLFVCLALPTRPYTPLSLLVLCAKAALTFRQLEKMPSKLPESILTFEIVSFLF